jgi:type III secretory pathway lipoprotein EscJ
LRTNEQAMPPPSASVTVKYLPTQAGGKPVSEPSIQGIVAASVEKLAMDRVVVAMVPSTVTPCDRSGGKASCPGPFGRLSEKYQLYLLVGIILLVLILSLLLVFDQFRLRTVRARLIRLQNEIAKARRKAPEGGSGPSE